MRPVYLFISPDCCHGDELVIGGEQFHHLVRVKRLGNGALLHAVLPDGCVFDAEIHHIAEGTLHARVTGYSPPPILSPRRITLYQAVLKGEKMDLIVQKATELGVSILQPLLTRRSVPRWSPAQAAERAERWQRIAEAAAEQCERSIPMRVASPCHCDELAPLPKFTLLWHEREGENLHALTDRVPGTHNIGLLIGPEGGWDNEEVTTFRTAGALPIHLGDRILRAETASITAIVLAQYLWGDL